MTNPQQPPQPIVVVKQKTSVGVWILVAWFVGPAVLLCGCCGLFGLIGGIGASVNP